MRNTGKSSKKKIRKPVKIIFIDRDGVINEDPIGDYVKTWREFRFLPEVLKSLRRLTNAGYRIVIISNQAGIGDGAFSKKSLDQITGNMLLRMKKSGIAIHGIYYCLHGKQANCGCRKPKTGLFKQAATDIPFDPRKTFFIGDKATDVMAGKRFHLKTAFVLTGHGASDLKKLGRQLKPDLIANDLSRAVNSLLRDRLGWI